MRAQRTCACGRHRAEALTRRKSAAPPLAERERTLRELEEHVEQGRAQRERATQLASALGEELAATRAQLDRALDELRPAVGSAAAQVVGLDQRLAEARADAEHAARRIELALGDARRALERLQGDTQRLLTRVAIYEQRQKVLETQVRAVVRAVVREVAAAEIDAARAEALEAVRATATELRYEASAAQRTAEARVAALDKSLGGLRAEVRAAVAARQDGEAAVAELARRLGALTDAGRDAAAADGSAAGGGGRHGAPRWAALSASGSTLAELEHDLYVHAQALEQLKRHRVSCPTCGSWHTVSDLIRLATVGRPAGGAGPSSRRAR